MTDYLIAGFFAVVLICVVLATRREQKLAEKAQREGNRSFTLHLSELRVEARARR